MTLFNKEFFCINSGYITYQGKFVARFKYQRGSARGFAKFVADNFSVEEYFQRLNDGESPLPIAESRGYIQPHIKRILKTMGYPVTVEGKRMLVVDQIAARRG